MASELVRVEIPWVVSHLRIRMSEGPDSFLTPGQIPNRDTPAGFEDVIPGGLGTGPGRYFNTPTSTHQLRVALGVSPRRERIEEIVLSTEGSGTRHLITTLRAEQVLAGMKVADLGCGIKPGFAMAASSMGAEVHTVDASELDPGIQKRLASHTVVDLSDPEAVAKIQESTGEDLDFVTTNILGKVPMPGFEHTKPPLTSTLRHCGAQLLRSGGYYFDNDFFEGYLYQKPMDV